MGVVLEYKGKKWRVAETFTVKVNGCSFVIPEGFRTDLASIPRIFWAIFPPFGKYNRAAIVHDYLYRIKTERKFADKIFLSLMEQDDTNVLIRYLFYYTVRLFGWIPYNTKHRKLCKKTCSLDKL